MYALTYFGRWFNGTTVLLLLWVGLFSVPKIYSDNKKQIDDALVPMKTKLNELMGVKPVQLDQYGQPIPDPIAKKTM